MNFKNISGVCVTRKVTKINLKNNKSHLGSSGKTYRNMNYISVTMS